MKTPRFTKIVSITSGFLSLFLPTTLSSKSTVQTCATNNNITREIDHSFVGEAELPSELNVKITSSTKTSMGQSFSLNFSTGGRGFSDNSGTFVVAPNDDSFSQYYDSFLKTTLEEKNEMSAQYNRGEYQTAEFDAFIYSLNSKDGPTDIYIPRALKRNVYFQFNIKTIGEKAVSDWTDINSITIPKEVKHVFNDSFENVPNNVTFYVEYSQAQVPDTWESGWAHGANVVYSSTIPSAKQYPLCNSNAPEYGPENAIYILGWESENDSLPLTLEYDVEKTNSTVEKRYYDMPVNGQLKNSKLNAQCDCVGKLIASYSSSLNVDIPLNEGENIKLDSLRLHNIRKALSNKEQGVHPDLTASYVCTPKKSFEKIMSLDDFITYKFTRLSSFNGYTAIDLDMSISRMDLYGELKSNYYLSHKAKLDSGVEHIRYRITSLSLCSFNIVYNNNGVDVEKNVKIKTPIQQVVLSNKDNSKVAFVLKNTEISDNPSFSSKDIKQLSFKSLYLTVDLYGEKGPIARSNVITRFGYASIMPYTENATLFDVSLFIGLFALIYFAAFALVSIVLFVYFKSRFKNDEFRRLKPKQFIKKAILAFAGSLIVLLLANFIVFRCTMFANAIVVYNPIDAFIIIFGVLSVIIIGYFLFYMFKTFKTANERKKVIKLKLADDKLDDGTK